MLGMTYRVASHADDPGGGQVGELRHHDLHGDVGARASAPGAINLGQGFPDEDGPRGGARGRAARDPRRAQPVRAAAGRAGAARGDRRPPGALLRDRRWTRTTQVQVTFGATEAIAAALLGLLRPRRRGRAASSPTTTPTRPAIAMAGAVRRPVTLRPPDWPVRPGRARAPRSRRARRCCSSTRRTTRPARCSPATSCELVAAACIEHDLIAITDEVYEHLVFDGEHVPLATLPGMAERTLTISSLGKTFSRHRLEDRLGDRARRSWWPRCARPSST